MTKFPLIALSVALFMSFGGSLARAEEVDVALVLAVDVSTSVNEDRYHFQMHGFAEAFRSADVIHAIRQGRHGAIAVTLLQWASYGDYRQVVDWTIVDSRTSANRFADAILGTARALEGATSLGGAIDGSASLLKSSGHNARRKVIDVSGDGSNNSGRPPGEARDQAVAAGITINGLPILTQESMLDAYYRDNVIGGPGAFLVVAEDFESFSIAILQKLTTEIAGEDVDFQRVSILPPHFGPFD